MNQSAIALLIATANPKNVCKKFDSGSASRYSSLKSSLTYQMLIIAIWNAKKTNEINPKHKNIYIIWISLTRLTAFKVGAMISKKQKYP